MRNAVGLLVVIWTLTHPSSSPVEAAAPRPNIVVILADDMGYSDVGCYGGEIATPHLDALASKGVRFTQFYNTARCCPTRASLLTGLYPHQAGVGHMTEDRGHDGYRGILNRRSRTIAEVLRPSGYRSYMVGKWHLTRLTGPKADRATWPLGRGFEKYYGTIDGAGSYYDPSSLTRGDSVITVANDPEYRPEAYYYTDALADNAVRFLAQHQAETPDRPFFLYTAFTAAHWPMQAPDAAVARYQGRFDGGYAPSRAGRFERMLASGLLPPDSRLSPLAGHWEGVANKAWEARCQEVYAAMVTAMDAGIGRIVAQLQATGQLDNTLILYLQDNGACAETVGRIAPTATDPGNLKPLAADEPQPRVQPPMQTRDGRWVRSGPGVMPGPADTYLAYGRGWANVSNTPFREYKHYTQEGGISTPLIAHWPAGIAADRAGTFERQPGHLIDIMATCVDLAGASYPTEVAGQAIKPLEGVSLRPAFVGEPLPRTRPLCWEHEGNRALRLGDWKLVAKEGEPWELYNLAADRSELTDLAPSQPDRVRALAAAWDAYAARCDVLPLGAWKADNQAPTRQTRFALKPGDHLDRAAAPPIANRPFTITARFTAGTEHPTGVLVAQGATAAGYTLFLRDGQPVFFLRTASGTSEVAGPRLAPGEHTVRARVDPQGRLTLAIDGQPAGPPVPGKLLARMPADGLDVGRDDVAPVGPYPVPNAFGGPIESVTIEVGGQ